MPFKIVKNDITKMKVDAIVNTANPRVNVGRGVDEAIYQAAGWRRLFREREKIGPMQRGTAAITPAFRLPAKYIIHTVGPKWDPADVEHGKKQLRDCYDNSLSLAMEHGVKSIAFPLISTGSYSFPKELGLEIAYETISKYLYVSDMDVYLVVYDDEAFELSKKLTDDIDEFIDEHYVDEDEINNQEALVNYSCEYNAAAEKPTEDLSLESEVSYRSAPMDMGMPVPEADEAAPMANFGGFGMPFPEKQESYRMPSAGIPKASKAPIQEKQAPKKPAKKDTIPFKEYKSLEDLLKNSTGETFQERLFRYIDKSGLSDVEVYKGANLSKQTFSKIKQTGHIPKKKTIFALALSMKLSIDETKDLLESAGQAFSPSDKIDLVIQYCMYHDIYSIFDVERILFDKFGETLVS
ncbi:MAG: macro domain-containing protein [Clostridiales bacterium]|nr:macro domain-containing protein [Clostridiales bacterium]